MPDRLSDQRGRRSAADRISQARPSRSQGPRTGKEPSHRSQRLPGYGRRVELSGLERPRQWLGVILATAVVLIVVVLIAYVAYR